MSSTLLANLRTQWDDTAARMGAITETAAAANRDLNDVERANFGAFQTQLNDLRPRIEQLVEVERSLDSTAELFSSISNSGRADLARHEAPSVVSRYGTPGEYLFDVLRSFGPGADREARQRISQAALVQRTTINGDVVADQTIDDILGIVPEPIVGPVWTNVDARRPLVATFVQRPLTAPLMYRPKVSQHTLVGTQGTAGKIGNKNNIGATVDEKKAFESREMKLTRIEIEPTALGGVVDLSLWAEMLSPGLLDMVVSDLADQYAIVSESYAAALLVTVGTANAGTSIVLGPDTVVGAIYAGAADIYATTGRLPSHVAISVDVWAKLGGMVDTTKRPLFGAFAPSNSLGGLDAGSLAVPGGFGGLRVVVSPALPALTAIVYAAEGMEVFERRLGVLQAIEPERAGRVVSYSGLFAVLAMDAGVAHKVPMTLT
jgi:hypothetical protein